MTASGMPEPAGEASHGSDDACTEALARVQAFLHNELPGTQADLIRAHLEACEKCLEDFDVEATIARLLKRSCQGPEAPSGLRVRIMSMRVDTYRFEQ